MQHARRHTCAGELSVTCTSAAGATASGVRSELRVVAMMGEDGRPLASAVATMQRPRRAEYEDLSVHVFVDGVFVDTARALQIPGAPGSVVFLARIRLPDGVLDGRSHTAHVRFVSPQSRVVVRGMTRGGTQILERVDPEPEPTADAAFVATVDARWGRATA